MKKLFIIAAFTLICTSAQAEVSSSGVGPMAKEELRGGQFICDEKVVNKEELNIAYSSSKAQSGKAESAE